MKAETAGQRSARKLRPLPPGWRWVRLGEICQVNPSRSPNFQRPADAPTTFVPMEAVDEEQGAITRPQTKPYHEVMKGYTYFEEGDIIWAKITPCMENGKSAVARGLRDSFAFGSTEFHVIRPTSIVIPEFIWHFVRQPSFRLEATRHFVGAVGQQRVPEVFLKNALLPLPPLTEQRAIVARLEAQMAQVQRLRAAAQRQLEAARAIQGAILRQVFRYKEGESLPPGWRWVRLGNCLTDVQPGIACGDKSLTEGVPHLRMNNISSDGRIDLSLLWRIPVSKSDLDKYRLRSGDVLFNNTNSVELVGKTALFTIEDGDYVFSNHLTRLRTQVDVLRPGWLAFYLRLLWQNHYFERVADRWIGQSAVRDDILRSLLFPLPPTDQQDVLLIRLEAQVAQAQRLRAAAERQLEAIHALPGALLNEVFGGFEPPAGSEPAGGYGR